MYTIASNGNPMAHSALAAACMAALCYISSQDPPLSTSSPSLETTNAIRSIPTLPVVSDVMEAAESDAKQDQVGSEWLSLDYLIVWPEMGIHKPTKRTVCVSLQKVSAGEVRKYFRHLVQMGKGNSIDVDLWNAYRNSMVPDNACARYLLESEVSDFCLWKSVQIECNVRTPMVDEIMALDAWARGVALKHGLDPGEQRPHLSASHKDIMFSDLYDCSIGERLCGVPTRQLIESLNFSIDEETQYDYLLIFSRMDDAKNGLDIRAEGSDSRTDDVGFRLVRTGL